MAKKLFSPKKKEPTWVTPVKAVTEDGVYLGHDGSAWLYWVLPNRPLVWEDSGVRLMAGLQLESVLAEIGETSLRPVGNVASLGNNRVFHIAAIRWEDRPRPSQGSSPQLAGYLRQTYQFLSPQRAVFVGVKLRTTSTETLKRAFRNITQKGLGDQDLSELDGYEKDFEAMTAIMARNDMRRPKPHELRQLESWYNLGRGPAALVTAEQNRLLITAPGGRQFDSVELAAVTRTTTNSLSSPGSMWISDACNHPHSPRVVSVRGELEPVSVTAARTRRQQRRIETEMKDMAKAGMAATPQDTSLWHTASNLENYLAGNSMAWLTKVSIVMGRRATEATDTYADFLRTVYGVEFDPLHYQQMSALEETLPCSQQRTGAAGLEANIAMLAYAGLASFSELGDSKGIFLGRTLPDGVPCLIDPLGANAEDKPPLTLVCGDSGSGKAQPVSEPVLTPKGWVAIGSLKPGDKVIGSDGHPTEVIGVYPQGVKRAWKIEFSDGTSTRSCDEHLWQVATPRDRAANIARVLPLYEIRRTLRFPGGNPRWYVPIVAPVHLTTTSNPIGTNLEDWTKAGSTWETTSLPIPDWVMTAHPDHRRSWIDGFMATHQRNPGQLRVVTELATQIQELVLGLGGYCKPNKQRALKVTLSVAFPTTSRPVTKSIHACTPEDPEQHVCIKVAAADRLYVTKSFILTHNTFACQMIATQTTLQGLTTVIINPKPFSSLEPFAAKIGGTTLQLSALEAESGALDPWRYLPAGRPVEVGRVQAAEIAAQFILAALGTNAAGGGFTQEMELDLVSGLRRGAQAGARSTGEALLSCREDVQEQVRQQVEGSSLFALGVGFGAVTPFELDSGLTLIEFDRELPFPAPGKAEAQHTRTERIALATMRLLVRAAMEIINNARGGVLIFDEAWTFLSHTEGLAALQGLGRTGRSIGVWPVLATQRIADVVASGRDMEGYVSRVLVLKLMERREAVAALKLCGLDPTEDRIQNLQTAGAIKATEDRPGRGSICLHRDIYNRHAAIEIGPVPDEFIKAWSTTMDEAKRAELRASDAEARKGKTV